MKRSRKTGLLFLCIFVVGLLIGFAMSGCGSGRTAAPAAAAPESAVKEDASVPESVPEEPEESLVLIEEPDISAPEASEESSEEPQGAESVTESIQESLPEPEEEENPEESVPETEPEEETGQTDSVKVVEGQYYFSAEDVAAYLNTYGKLPPNYITKQKAQDLGWVASKGNLWKVTDHGVIGGDRFGNYEGQLPKKKNRKYYECDVNYDGGHRGAERLIYSSDGLIYYTGDHYETFTLLYGEE